ncbi:MAG TPA: hypothetical protein VGP76_11530 [Planctomycetaceae bacterium]|jgi:hypothetical protein|nr:hypothetical protein [Planctomycetaceae bacterium]
MTGLAATRFANMGVNLTPLGFSPYVDIIKQLLARGIPRKQQAKCGSHGKRSISAADFSAL